MDFYLIFIVVGIIVLVLSFKSEIKFSKRILLSSVGSLLPVISTYYLGMQTANLMFHIYDVLYLFIGYSLIIFGATKHKKQLWLYLSYIFVIAAIPIYLSFGKYTYHGGGFFTFGWDYLILLVFAFFLAIVHTIYFIILAVMDTKK